MKKNYFSLILFFMLSYYTQAQNLMSLQVFSTGYTRISCIASAGDNRLFVVNQNGYIDVCDSLGVRQTPSFLDIDSKVKSSGNEQGLLGLAFHPDYKNNGYFYVYYINNSNNSVIARYSVSAANPNLADASSELILLTVTQPYSNHNGGDMHFGPDGYLYVGFGDGGSAGDPGNRAQNPQDLLGKMIRIDVNNSSASNLYDIPPTNPFVSSTSTLPEIWSIGLRNPWRYSFDKLTGDMWIADVGQNMYEEIDFQPASSTGGENYGWRCYEANTAYNTAGCQPQNTYVSPVATYAHTGGSCSVTGGFVYRGSIYSDLYGKYIYCDYCSGKFWFIEPNGAGGWNNLNAGTFTAYRYSCFGQNNVGELFVGGNDDGKVYRIKGLCLNVNNSATVQDAYCAGQNTGAINLTASGGTPPLSYSWSNGAATNSLSGLAPGTYVVTITDSLQCVKKDTFTVGSGVTVAVTGNPVNVNCNGGNDGIVSVVASGGNGNTYTYSWSNGQSGNNLSGLTAGSYTVTATDSLGCEGSQTFQITEPTAIVSQIDSVAPAQISVTASGGIPPYTYLWSTGQTTPSVSCAPGMISVLITDSNGCTQSDSLLCPEGVSILTASDIASWIVKPNPATEYFETEIRFSSPSALTLTLFDAKGRKIQELNFDKSEYNHTRISVASLPSGIYWIQASTDKGKEWRKIIRH